GFLFSQKTLDPHMLKRGFDFTISLIGLIISAPLWILFSVVIWLEDRGPIFYL
ncbi:MAG TPA: hypothetical protein DEP99_05750, partial [Nitrospiraceae bacterium]|nr:hypothetical protein [Nitrospiraceae bacterium]